MGQIEKFFNKMMPAFMKFANSKVVSALKDGFVLTMPLTLIGSVFMLIGISQFQIGMDLWKGYSV